MIHAVPAAPGGSAGAELPGFASFERAPKELAVAAWRRSELEQLSSKTPRSTKANRRPSDGAAHRAPPLALRAAYTCGVVEASGVAETR